MQFKLGPTSKKTGEATVFIRYVFEGKDILKSTGVKVLPVHFTSSTGKVSKRDTEAATKQAAIGLIRQTLESYVAIVVAEGYKPTTARVAKFYDVKQAKEKEIVEAIEQFRVDVLPDVARMEAEVSELEGKLSRKKELLTKLKYALEIEDSSNLFLTGIDAFIQSNPNNVYKTTIKGYETFKSQIRGFNKSLVIQDINLTTFEDFQTHLSSRGVKNNSVRLAMTRFKTIYKHCAKKEKILTDFLSELKLIKELADENKFYLNKEELDAIHSLTNLNPYQRQVQQQFLFCCYTGLRHSDICISKANIQGDYIEKIMQKSKRQVKTPLTDDAKAILNSEYFPFIETDVSNFIKSLKRLCKKLPVFNESFIKTSYVGSVPIAEIKKKYEMVSSHTARRTAINYWIRKGVGEITVARWAGHKDTKMIDKHYANKDLMDEVEVSKLK